MNIIFRSQFFESEEKQQAHKKGLKLVGEAMLEKSKKLLGLLYALAFYRTTEDEMDNANLSDYDKNIITQAGDMLSSVYRRLLKHEHGWKAAAGKLISHCFYLKLLKENSKLMKKPSQDKTAFKKQYEKGLEKLQFDLNSLPQT